MRKLKNGRKLLQKIVAEQGAFKVEWIREAGSLKRTCLAGNSLRNVGLVTTTQSTQTYPSDSTILTGSRLRSEDFNMKQMNFLMKYCNDFHRDTAVNDQLIHST